MVARAEDVSSRGMVFGKIGNSVAMRAGVWDHASLKAVLREQGIDDRVGVWHVIQFKTLEAEQSISRFPVCPQGFRHCPCRAVTDSCAYRRRIPHLKHFESPFFGNIIKEKVGKDHLLCPPFICPLDMLKQLFFCPFKPLLSLHGGKATFFCDLLDSCSVKQIPLNHHSVRLVVNPLSDILDPHVSAQQIDDFFVI